MKWAAKLNGSILYLLIEHLGNCYFRLMENMSDLYQHCFFSQGRYIFKYFFR